MLKLGFFDKEVDCMKWGKSERELKGQSTKDVILLLVVCITLLPERLLVFLENLLNYNKKSRQQG